MFKFFLTCSSWVGFSLQTENPDDIYRAEVLRIMANVGFFGSQEIGIDHIPSIVDESTQICTDTSNSTGSVIIFIFKIRKLGLEK